MPLLSESMPYIDNLVSGLALAAVGGGAARMITHRRPEESEEQYKRRLALATTTGVVGGGAVGAGLPLAINSIKGMMPVSIGDKFDNGDYAGAASSALSGGLGWLAGNIGIGGAAGGVIGAGGRRTYMAGKEVMSEKALEAADKHLQAEVADHASIDTPHQKLIADHAAAERLNTPAAATSKTPAIVPTQQTQQAVDDLITRIQASKLNHLDPAASRVLQAREGRNVADRELNTLRGRKYTGLKSGLGGMALGMLGEHWLGS